MTVSYKIYKTKDFIRRTEKGEINMQQSLNTVADLAAASKFHKDVNILIDVRDTETTLDLESVLKVAFEFGNYKNCFRNKIAGVIPDDPERIDRAVFFKVGMEAGGFLFDFFTDYEKAIEWLSEVESLNDKGLESSDH